MWAGYCREQRSHISSAFLLSNAYIFHCCLPRITIPTRLYIAVFALIIGLINMII